MANPYRENRPFGDERQRWRDDDDHRITNQYSGIEESPHWREDNRRNPYDRARNATPDQDWSRDYPQNQGNYTQRRSRGGYQGAQLGSWDQGSPSGGAVGSELYGGYDRYGAGRGVSQSSYGGYDDYGYGQSGYRDASMPRQGQTHGRQSGREDWRGRQDYEAHGYAPGSQIWDQNRGGYGYTRSGVDAHEPDYRHWREQQMRGFDDDYAAWRSERREKFSSDFDTWRRNRPRSEGKGHHLEAENPVVGSVSDGDNGDMSKKKN